jgi:hypothetical protein
MNIDIQLVRFKTKKNKQEILFKNYFANFLFRENKNINFGACF